MPLIIPKELPAYTTLQNENVFVMNEERAKTQEIRPLKILVLNLMPTKIVTETQIARLLANNAIQLEVTFLKTATYKSTNVSFEHLEAFYRTFDEIKNQFFDGLIITGAPVENMKFEDVQYWEELCAIFEYAKTHVYSTLHVCWGAQAGLYFHYGVDKYKLDKKVSGVFKHQVHATDNPLIRGFDEEFYAPHSRYTDIVTAMLEHKDVQILASSKEAGVYLVASSDCRKVFVTGHPEYDTETLDIEYNRDIKKGIKIDIPYNYYQNDDPKQRIINRWKSHATLLYVNWINIVYQQTPYNLEELLTQK